MVQIKDTSSSPRKIQDTIDSWEEIYGNSKPQAVHGILEMIKIGYCDEKCMVDSEARHLCKQMTRKIFNKNNMGGCKHAIKEKYITHVKDGDSREARYNKMLDEIIHEYDIISRQEAMHKNLKSLDDRFNIESMFNREKAFYYEEYSKHAIDKLCHAINETYKDKMDRHRIITICMEMSKIIFDHKPGVISEQDILENISSFFLISEDVRVIDIQVGLDNLILYDKKDINPIVESLESIDYIISINESEDLDLESKDYKNMIKRMSYKMRSIFEDTIKLAKMSINKNKNNNKKMIDRITKTLYGTPVKTIVDGAPDLIGLVRRTITYGAAMAVNPLFVIPAIIIDALIEANIDTKEVPKVIKALEIERDKALNSLNDKTIDIHPDNKPELERHIEDLNRQIERLKLYIEMHELGYYINDDYHNENYNEHLAYIMGLSENMFSGDDQIIITENVVKNTMRTAKEKLRSATETLSAREKAVSRKIDTSVDKFVNSFEKAMALENREKVIKGDVLPNASKVIKLGITTGAAWAIHPAIAIVGAISSWALSKNVRDRERQMVLDEIKVHQQIVERKIQQADMNNDIDAVEQLMKLQGKLNREEQRIKYRQKAYR